MTQEPVNQPRRGERYQYDVARQQRDDGRQYECRYHYITDGEPCCPAAKEVKAKD